MLKIHETIAADGSVATVHLEMVGERVVLHAGGDVLALPPTALAAVMSRYGGTFDERANVNVVDSLAVPGGTLRHVRYLLPFDVIARDYLVYGTKCALATTVAGALEHLARAYKKQGAGEAERN